MQAIIISAGDKNACIHVLFWKLPCSIPVFLATSVMANQQFFGCGQNGSCEDGCGQPLLRFSHELVFSTELFIFPPGLASFPGWSSELSKGKPCCSIHGSTYPQQPGYSDKHMFLGDFMGYMEASVSSFLWLRNQCIPTLAGNRFRHLPCPGFHRSLDPSM